MKVTLFVVKKSNSAIMRRFFSIITLLVCVLMIPSLSAQSRGVLPDANELSLYVKGGVSKAMGLDFNNVNPPIGIDYSPAVGGGLSFEFAGSVRLGLNYEFTKLKREQRLNALEPTAPRLDFPGATYNGGTAYRNMWTHFNDADVSIEYNFCNLIPALKMAGFGLYLGTGAGMAFSNGYKYTISMAHEEYYQPGSADDKKLEETWVSALNEKHNYRAFYIPATLSAEFAASKSLTVGLRYGYRFFLQSTTTSASEVTIAPAPTGLMDLSVLLRIRLF